MMTSDSAANSCTPGAKPMMSRIMAQVDCEAALEPADHGVGIAAPHGKRRDDGGVGAHQRARRIGRDALAAGRSRR